MGTQKVSEAHTQACCHQQYQYTKKSTKNTYEDRNDAGIDPIDAKMEDKADMAEDPETMKK